MADFEKNIVIVGGSYGGVSVAHHLLKHTIPILSGKELYRVIIISTASEVICRPACPRALISDDLLPQDKLFVSIPKVFEQYPQNNFRFVQGTATGWDYSKRKVQVEMKEGGTEEIHYHALVVATGASTASPMLSLNKDEHFLRENWNVFRQALPTAKTIVVAGGGPAGVETAAELGEHLNGRAGIFSSSLKDPKVKIIVVNSGSDILPALRPSIAQAATGLLAKIGVTVINNTRVTSVSPSDAGTATNLTTKATVALDHGDPLTADLYIPAMGTTPNTKFIDPSLLISDGRLDTHKSTLRVEKAGERVYAIGDASSYGAPTIHNMTSAIPILGANMKRDLLLAAGQESKILEGDKAFKEDIRETQMVLIGKSKAVGAVMGWRLPGSLVRLIKGNYWLWTTPNLWSGKQWAKE